MGVPAKPLLAGSPGVLQSFQSYGRGRVSMDSLGWLSQSGTLETGWPPIAAFSVLRGGRVKQVEPSRIPAAAGT